ncbi:hypothetical protein RFI_31970, partial [Reticulomyxa filosa]
VPFSKEEVFASKDLGMREKRQLHGVLERQFKPDQSDGHWLALAKRATTTFHRRYELAAIADQKRNNDKKKDCPIVAEMLKRLDVYIELDSIQGMIVKKPVLPLHTKTKQELNSAEHIERKHDTEIHIFGDEAFDTLQEYVGAPAEQDYYFVFSPISCSLRKTFFLCLILSYFVCNMIEFFHQILFFLNLKKKKSIIANDYFNKTNT